MTTNAVFSRVSVPAADAPISDGEAAYAVEAMALEYFFQPIIHMRSWACVGAEVIVRWAHPVRGLLPSEVVRAHAERSPECVRRLTDALLGEALFACRRWRQSGRRLGVRVPLTSGMLAQRDLPERIGALLRDHGLGAGTVTIQLAGVAPQDDLGAIVDVASRLHRLGVRLAFYFSRRIAVSMPALLDVPLDELTLPAESLAGRSVSVGRPASIDAGLALARSRALVTTCVGVSTQAEWNLLDRLGCDSGQGDFVARAMSDEAFGRWMRRWMPSERP